VNESTAKGASLLALACAHGVTTDYVDWRGTPTRVPESTLRAVLAALGVPAETDAQVNASLDAHLQASFTRPLPPTVVVRQADPASIPINVPDRHRASAAIVLGADPALKTQGGRIDLGPLELGPEFEDDGATHPSATHHSATHHSVTLTLPDNLPLGWHTLHLTLTSGQGAILDTNAVLVVAPDRLQWPSALTEDSHWGVMAQLYAARSRRSWGVGDFADLATLADTLAQDGADFLLVNPLHAAEPSGHITESPYLPTSRTFLNPLYIRPQDIPEYADAPDPVRQYIDEWAAALAPDNADASVIDRDRSWNLKRQALELLFGLPRSSERASAFAAYRRNRGAALEDFALWCLLVDAPKPDVHALPSPADLPRDCFEAHRIAAAHRTQIEFYCWLQWVASSQLAEAQRRAVQAGMAIGIVGDMAVGVHPDGADAWRLARVLAPGIEVGAPPDFFNQRGQRWNQPPLSPTALAETGYAAYRSMLRSSLSQTGGLRIDHILGLFRLWWIPAGQPPSAGTYVRYDHEAMVSILALEATRAGAVVIGEDLGLSEPGALDYLASRGIAGNSLTWFEEAEDAAHPAAPESYRRFALTMLTTHDLPPTGAYLRESHLDLRVRYDLLDTPEVEARAGARAEREVWTQYLVDRGWLNEEQRAEPDAIIEGLHRFLFATPSIMIGVALSDLVGEERSENLPGTNREYPNWCVPLAGPDGSVRLIEDIREDPHYRRLIAVIQEASNS
jgi:4-alpha-glucanotransferase